MASTMTDLLVKPTVKFYKRTILKDPFHVAVRQWKRDRGDQTLRLDYPLGEDSTVLDVGGYRGDFANSIIERYRCKVVVFEPMPQFYEHCKARFANQPNVVVKSYGLGSCDQQLNLSDSADASSFYRADGSAATIAAQIRDIASVWKELGLTHVGLLKVNIEGGEYPLLSRIIDCGLVASIDDIQVQFHDFFADAADQRDAIRARLTDTHDESWCYSFVWENWKRKTIGRYE